MGVLTDYFRAADTASVVRALRRADGGPLVGVKRASFDGVDAKGVDSQVVLGTLIAAVRQEPWRTGLVEETMVWPTTPVPGAEGPAEDDPWATGPWVSKLDSAVRDTLAGAPDADLPRIAAEWTRNAEELRGAAVDDMRALAADLIQLARRARTAREDLYCWTCL
jgi:hypothetical protein